MKSSDKPIRSGQCPKNYVRTMTVQSPNSVQSQILTNDEAISTLQFVSQLPFQTQVPYEVPVLRNQPSITNTESEQRSNILDELRSVEVAQVNRSPRYSQSNAAKASSNHGKQSDQSEVPISKTSLDDSENMQNTEDHARDQDHFPSTNGSLDCRPIQIPLDGKQTTQTQAPTDQRISLLNDLYDNQPFSLYDRIRAIRADTSRRGQKLSAKWARSIPKTQKTILDSEDAWNPPLPGRSYRQGTIPIDILNLVTIRADHEAEEKEQRAKKGRDSVLDSENNVHAAVSINAPPLSCHSLAAEPPADESDDSSEAIEASEWASSPPQPKRVQLPPDTSPVRSREPNILGQNLSSPGESLANATARPKPQFEHGQHEHPKSQQVSTAQVIKSSSLDDHNAGSVSQGGLATDMPHIELEKLPDSKEVLEQQIVTNISEQQADKQLGKVQVKHTPYPPKGGLGAKKQLIVTSDIPQSSFVPATFPDTAVRQRSGSVGASMNKVHSHVSKLRPSSQASDLSVRPAQLSLQQNQRPVSRISEAMLVPVRGSSIQLASADEQPSKLEPQTSAVSNRSAPSFASSSTRKRSRDENDRLQSQSVRYTDPAYEEHDRIRKRQRQDFRQTHSKHKSKANIDRSIEGTGQQVVEQDSNSFENGTRHIEETRNRGNGQLSVMGSEKDVSIHQSTMAPTMSRSLGRNSGFGERSDMAFASLLTKFKSSYPSYRGTEKSFRSALELLLKFQENHKRFHPYMWDDFVYRFAHDYKSYVQTCLEKDENVLPYEDFYQSKVEEPDRTKRCVTAENLNSILGCDKLIMRRYSKSSSDLTMDMSNIRSMEITPECAVTDRAEFEPPNKIKPTQNPPGASIQETPAVQRYQSPSIEVFRGKRRCLPPAWPNKVINKTSTVVVSVKEQTDLTARDVQNLTSTPEPSSKVEKWLKRPHGGESPELLPEEPPSRVRGKSSELLSRKTPSLSEAQPDRLNNTIIEAISSQSARVDNTNLCLPGYLTPNNTVLRSIESSDPTDKRIPNDHNRISQNVAQVRQRFRKSDLPNTLFLQFEKDYNSLAEEQKSRKAWKKNQSSGINLSNW